MYPSIVVLGRTFGMYPLFALAGALCAGALGMRRAKKRGYNDNDMLVLLLVSSIGVFLGGALLSAIVNLQAIRQYIVSIGGITGPSALLQLAVVVFSGSVFYGGLLGGLAAGGLYMHARRLPFSEYTDLCAPLIPLFHLFGRLGCFFGGCCYGIPWAHGVTFTRSPVALANGVPRLPVQLLEAGVNLLLFLMLSWLLAKGLCKGKLLVLYLLAYAVARFCLEFLRGDIYRGFLWRLSTSQWISLALLLVCALVLLAKHKSTRAATQGG